MGRCPDCAHSHATVFGCKDFCGSTVLGTPGKRVVESLTGMIDWVEALQMITSGSADDGRAEVLRRLEELSQHGQARASQH